MSINLASLLSSAAARAALPAAALAAALIAAPGHARAAGQVTGLDVAGCSSNVAINNAIGQSFRVPSAIALDRIELYLKPNLYYDTSYNIELFDGEGPVGAPIATSAVVNLGALDDGVPIAWRGFSFGFSVELAPNHTYTLRLNRLSQYSGGFGRCTNAYANGKLYWLGSYPQSHEDMAFRVYGEQNLLVNGHASAGNMTGWTITANGGAGWKAASGLFFTSYFLDSRTQLVDLHARGYDAAAMASAPPIHISEQFSATYCPDSYFLKVELLDAAMNVVDTFDTGTVQQTGTCVWADNPETVSHTFTAYGPNVRYVRWSDGGKDSEFWAGHYGPRLDNAILTVGRNLLVNPAADAGDLSGWTITANGGEGWKVIHNEFATSYFQDTRTQLVDLFALGYDAQQMSSAPPIFVSERSRKTYCPDFYSLKVELLDAAMNVVDVFDTGTLQHAGTCQWDHVYETVSFTFTGYGPGVRYVRWTDGGKDSEFWAGHYGPRFDDAVLTLR